MRKTTVPSVAVAGTKAAGFLVNKDARFNKFVIAAYGATMIVAQQLGYPEIAERIAAIGLALGVVLVGNGAKPNDSSVSVVVADPPVDPSV